MDKAIRGDIEKACINMGVIDKRTACKHLARFDACLSYFVVFLATTISEFGENLPDRKPGGSSHAEENISWFRELVSVIISIRERLFGFENISEKDIAALFQFFIHRSYPVSTCTNIGDKKFSIFLRSPP